MVSHEMLYRNPLMAPSRVAFSGDRAMASGRGREDAEGPSLAPARKSRSGKHKQGYDILGAAGYPLAF